MLSFLLDEHISPEVSIQIQSKNPSITVRTLQRWKGGQHLGVSDKALLELAKAHSLTLVTYDVTTIPPLLNRLYSNGEFSHSGIIFISAKTIAPDNIGLLTRELLSIWDKTGQQSWEDRIVNL
ncbi:MAG: DUF5615 family PIN-like protein [Cyanobacteria bacterium J06634_6]